MTTPRELNDLSASDERRAIEELLNLLAAPIYVWRMARAQLNQPGPMGVSAQKRYDNALANIAEVLEHYDSGTLNQLRAERTRKSMAEWSERTGQPLGGLKQS